MLNGRTKSCGCIQRQSASETAIKSRKRPYEAFYNQLMRNAKKRNLVVDILYEAFLEYTKQPNCHYCTDPVMWVEYREQNTRGSKVGRCGYHLDRKDSSLGYLKANVVVACARCNWSKSDRFSYEEWFVMTAPLRFKGNPTPSNQR